MRKSDLRQIIREEIKRLNEGVTDIVYHYTNMKAALNILEKDKFLLRPALASSGDVETKFSSGRLYFLSTTRSKVDGFSLGNVRFTLDGRALGQRYKSNPIDYWQWDMSKDSYDNLGGWKSAVTSKEHEDRIVSDSPYIPNASKYIKEMHIYMDKPSQLVATLQTSGLIRKVAVFVYDDKSAYKLGNKRRAIDLSVVLANKEVRINAFDFNDVMRDYFPYKLAVLVSFGSKKALNTITKLVPDKGKFRKLFADSTPYSSFAYERERLYDFREAGKSMNPNERKLVDYIIRDMRKQGIKAFAEYFNYLEARAKKNGK
jgi:hypothetical protein